MLRLAFCLAIRLALTPPGMPRVPGHNMMVDLEQRPVARVYPAKGQINKIPGVWEPEWVDAFLLVYDNGWFSMLWQDSDRAWRHIMDFTPLAIPHGWGELPEHGEGGYSTA